MANSTRGFNQLDLSGGLQIRTSHLLRKHNEVTTSKNAIYNEIIGSAKRRDGYEKVGRTIEPDYDSLGFEIFRSGDMSRIISGISNTTGDSSTLRALDNNDYWTTFLTYAYPNIRFNMLNDNGDLYVAGASDNNVYLPLTNVTSQLATSTSRNVYNAPACKFIAEYNGELYAINCFVNGKYYPNRFYRSSPLLGAITYVQTDQKGLLKQLRVNSAKWLKPGMVFDIYSAGTEAKVESAITIISVDKKNNRISFEATAFDVQDNDELWLTGTKGTLSRFWNVDYPNPEEADWDQVPNPKEAKPTFTGYGKNNNRLFMFTRNSFIKWDGSNLITVSDNIGCVSHESIQNIGPWTLWLHDTGVWGYNDTTGQLKLLSAAIGPLIKCINQAYLSKVSAGVVGKVYKLAVGELLPLSSVTTSTSTSSTSTSSTSSSTSSTSTSSTSTSSTSTSTSQTTTSISTSSTSVSTSSISTSISSTSSSISTSSTSTSTSTLSPDGKHISRLCYDFDMNTWWEEEHTREIRYQRNLYMHGYTKPYFTDETGRLFRDETGNHDNNDAIPMVVQLGRDNFGTDQRKKYLSVLVDSENARGARLMYSLDGGQFKTLGTISENVQKMLFEQRGQLVEARDIDYKIVHNEIGDPPVINGLTTYYSFTELSVNA